jgi:hypothetical protein
MNTRTGFLLLLSVLPGSASAESRIWPLIGMSGAEATGLLDGNCPTLWEPPPYLTCINGEHVVTATSSDKDRIYYVQRLEPTDLSKSAYAAAVAAELGFDGEGVPCDRNGNPAICWVKPDGTQLFAAMDFNPGVLATQLYHPAIEAADMGP